MQLSSEDNLRLNVLLAQPLQAVRINEGTMTVHALTEKGEAKVHLNPTTKDEQYLRWVRELLSMKITGSPGGYPVFLKRWTRMGHAHNSLEKMLLLGEPEAVVAVVHSTEVSHEIGRRAWWANPDANTARRLLEKPAVVAGELGKELSQYLLEFLPFEAQPLDIVDTVRLCLQGDLLSETQRYDLWKRAKRKNPFYVGFLHADATLIPLGTPDHPAHEAVVQSLQPLLSQQNPFAHALSIGLSAPGQRWLSTLLLALEKPVDQEVVITLFRAIQKRFNLPISGTRGQQHIDLLETQAQQWLMQSPDTPDAISKVIQHLSSTHLPLLHSLLVLGQLGEDSLNSIFGGNDSVGSVMRKRLKPLTDIIIHHSQQLLHS